jgi:two-component system, OmpR family, response regulator
MLDVKPKILIVDDTDDIRVLLEHILTLNQFDVISCKDGAEMDACLKHTEVDAIILDVMMPEEDGLSICKRISAQNGPPILMLSAKGNDLDRVKGLELGADDYMAKPFNANELVARLKVILRRNKIIEKTPEAHEHFVGWRLENLTRRLTAPNNKSMNLSPAEYAVIRALVTTKERALKREEIMDTMNSVHEFTTERALDTLISRFRRKLMDLYPLATGDNELIRTIYGVGYALNTSQPHTAVA